MGHVFVIVNPASDNGATARFWPRARKTLADAGVKFRETLTEGPGHATDLAEKAGEEGYPVVLYVGGDGTATSVAVCNGPRFGGGMLMAPTALPDDGILDVVVMIDGEHPGHTPFRVWVEPGALRVVV